MSTNRLFKPKEMLEVILCQYDNGSIFWQFNGMDGDPAQPVDVYRLLATVANSLIQRTPDSVPASPVPDSPSHLYPQEALHG